MLFPRSTSRALVLILAAGVAPLGCQYITELSEYKVGAGGSAAGGGGLGGMGGKEPSTTTTGSGGSTTSAVGGGGSGSTTSTGHGGGSTTTSAGGGGGGGATTTTTTTGAGGSGGSTTTTGAGGAIGTLNAPCTADTMCESSHCTDGVCCEQASCTVDGGSSDCSSCAISSKGTCQNHLMGAPCGSQVTTSCANPETCDGAGTCQEHYQSAGTSCGVATPCSSLTCDATGTCQSNDLSGSCMKCSGSMVTNGMCITGSCLTQGSAQPCPGNLLCNAAGTACDPSCTTSADCTADTFRALGAMGGPLCAPCGAAPPNPTCNAGGPLCETCVGSTCTRTCDAQNPCTTSLMLNAMQGPVQLDCGDQCNNIIVTCQGPNLCSVDCEAGGCTNLVLNCAAGTPCSLTCNGGADGGADGGGPSCAGAKMTCQDNQCSATCTGGATVDQTCNRSCGCTNNGC